MNFFVRAFGRGKSSGGASLSGTQTPAGASQNELVAVIAAAVAAASGRKPGSFRLLGIEPSAEQGRSGFNTPVWGHADRLARSLARE